MTASHSSVGLLFLEGLRDDLRARIESQRAQESRTMAVNVDWRRLVSIATVLVSVWSCLFLALVSLRVPL